ncbi:hypothetical protein LUZ60_006190 [Juncus effusus]|nr:hypothetical protein LUZ60_006190 [Juncus effusus]
MLIKHLSRLRSSLRSSSPSPYPLSFFSTSSRRRKNLKAGDSDSDADDRNGLGLFVFRDPSKAPKLFVVQPKLRPEPVLQSKLEEALNLANSLEESRDGFYEEDFGSKSSPPHLVVQNPAMRSAHADTYFGPGTVDNIKCHVRALETESEIDAVFINTVLSGIQQRNLEVAFGKPVLDRVALIIEIFNAHAETKEAKLQSELAALMYKKTRLVRVRGPSGRLAFGPAGEAQVVSARGRGSGGRGFISGAGETELQLQRRRIMERRNKLVEQIKEVRRTRGVQRSARRRHACAPGQRQLATVAVVGYTNAGKSTLVSALSEAELYSDDRLFATVDPRLRSVILPSGRKVILSDTVGFISDLPHQLIEAFHATLEEVVEADLLVHVLDSSARDIDEHRSSVLHVLHQIGVSEEKINNMIEVWNKIDLTDESFQADEAFEDEETEVDDVASDGDVAVDDDMADDVMSSSETLDGEDDEMECEEELFEEEEEEDYDDDDDESSNSSDKKKGEMTEMPLSCHVKTSAIMGVGLQELLELIEERLEEKNVVQRNLGPFDRKWRPSYNTEITVSE